LVERVYLEGMREDRLGRRQLVLAKSGGGTRKDFLIAPYPVDLTGRIALKAAEIFLFELSKTGKVRSNSILNING
jgi:hypothetical protein